MSEDVGFQNGTEIRSVTPGYEARLNRDDGTGVIAWGPTKKQAAKNLKEEVAV